MQLDHLAGFDAIIHLAALSNDPLGNLDPRLTFEINEHAAVRLALAQSPAVRATRVQADRTLYKAAIRRTRAAVDVRPRRQARSRGLTSTPRSCHLWGDPRG